VCHPYDLMATGMGGDGKPPAPQDQRTPPGLAATGPKVPTCINTQVLDGEARTDGAPPRTAALPFYRIQNGKSRSMRSHHEIS